MAKQSSLLSFFGGNKPKETPHKPLDFSPKPRPSIPSSSSTSISARDAKTTTSTCPPKRARKAHEDFLGTSSDEKEEPSSKNEKRVRNDSCMSEKEAELGMKRPRRAAVVPKRRNKIVISDDESDDAPQENDNDSEFSGEEHSSSSSDDDEEEVEEEEESPSPKRRKPSVTPAKRPPKAFLSPVITSKNRGNSFTPPSADKKTLSSSPDNVAMPESTAPGVYGAGCHLHDSFEWLNEKRRDINGNPPTSPDYDARTLLVPSEFLRKETPAMQQWWQVKQHNMDTILFFKVGKFYELFHMDADVGFKELALIYMKGEKAHSGFPEIAYSRMSAQLVSKGYRVARVEQTETPEMLKKRNTTSSKKSKVVRREICSMLSVGTNTISFLDAQVPSQEQLARHLMSIKEDMHTDGVRIGVCLVDASTGAFQLAEFDDSEQRDRLKTLLAQYRVVEIVNERGNLSAETKAVLKFAAPAAVRGELRVGSEFWSASRALDEMTRAGYFENEWPSELLQFLDADKTVKEGCELAVSALGGCVWNLRRSLIDQELVSLCNFQKYTPPDEAVALSKPMADEVQQQFVVLDSQTIHNLEILRNNSNGGRKGSLIDVLDKTVTSFGKRMFQQWVLQPLCRSQDINDRLTAVSELVATVDLQDEVREKLRKLPDLERLLSRIHALGSNHRSQEHPDSRAVMYETTTYNKRKIRDFVAVLDGFEVAMDLAQTFSRRFATFTSPILRALLTFDTTTDLQGQFPDLSDRLAFFRQSFDRKRAQDTGVIVPQDGVDEEYDQSREELEEIQVELDTYLKEQQKRLQTNNISYWGKKKEDRYQLEVPESALKHHQPSEYELKSKRKGYKRFHTPAIRDMLSRLSTAEDRKDAALKDQMRRIFHKFDRDYRTWMTAVQCISILDCLLSLSIVSSQGDGYVRPEVVSAASNGSPFVDIEQGTHPCVSATYDSGDFIPNDSQVACNDHGRMLLLSGPNMGGKSTLLRQTCVLTLMAQIGCFVPAKKCRLSPVDRIFTRIGASDRILAGQSTLYVELAETATILHHATNHSLVILDELGRGTSTFDGTAIAYAVIEHLLRSTRCRTMFATHYHSLVEEYAADAHVSLGHMGCLVDADNERQVTFLYKLASGMCPKSYGINVAMLAKLPQEVVDLAASKSEQFERSLLTCGRKEEELERKVKEMVKGGMDVEDLKELWRQAQQLVPR